MTDDKSLYNEFLRSGRRIRQTARSSGYILIIEDDTAIAAVCTHLIKKCGIEFKWVSTVAAAREAIEQDHAEIQCVLADLTLPDGNGIEIVNLIESKYSTVPYVIHTANTECVESIRNRFPRAEVIFKHKGLGALIDALNLEEKLSA